MEDWIKPPMNAFWDDKWNSETAGGGKEKGMKQKHDKLEKESVGRRGIKAVWITKWWNHWTEDEKSQDQ